MVVVLRNWYKEQWKIMVSFWTLSFRVLSVGRCSMQALSNTGLSITQEASLDRKSLACK